MNGPVDGAHVDALLGHLVERTKKLADLEARIKRLEFALLCNRMPSSDLACECCGEIYVPLDWDSCRCTACCSTCCRPKGSKVWEQGRMCPAVKRLKKRCLNE